MQNHHCLRAHGLMYHDIQDGPASCSLGKRSYIVSAQSFSEHLRAMAMNIDSAPSIDLGSSHDAAAWAITFDDGSSSALTAADLLEPTGWRAYFFVVSSWIGKSSFLDKRGISELRDRGHIVGSHSLSHPERMSGLPYAIISQEWRKSADELGEMLGHPVRTASVPGGSFSHKVAEAAAEAGIEVLFTSEPISRIHFIRGCTVVGRYVIRNSTDATTVSALAAGQPSACTAQWLEWNSRKLAKSLMGNSYFTVRNRILAGRITK